MATTVFLASYDRRTSTITRLNQTHTDPWINQPRMSFKGISRKSLDFSFGSCHILVYHCTAQLWRPTIIQLSMSDLLQVFHTQRVSLVRVPVPPPFYTHSWFGLKSMHARVWIILAEIKVFHGPMTDAVQQLCAMSSCSQIYQ